MTYPIKERTYFKSDKEAWSFAHMIANLQHHIVTDYGMDATNEKEAYYIETLNDPFATKSELMAKVNK